MTLREYKGDLFTSGAPVIGHGVNVHGSMGGLAGIVEQKFPDVASEYRRAVETKNLRFAENLPVLTSYPNGDPLWILNMVTQELPGPNARLPWIRTTVDEALHFCELRHYSRFAIPRIGSGIGGLDWETEVRPTLLTVTNEYPNVDLAVFYLD